jgi:murein DD-endopeptidase MepM/ murein hydrolase activator NlpD
MYKNDIILIDLKYIMKIKIAENISSQNEADSLIENLLGETVAPSNNKDLTIIDSTISETYQLPVQVGQTGRSLSQGDIPWIVGNFSPNVATDKNHPKGHNGTDLKATKGTPVYPIASGIVKDVGNGTISGNFVSCLHEDGKVQSFYGHLDSSNVRIGQAISKTTVLGKVGESGNAKGRGAHLHFEVKVNGSLINPLSIPGKLVGSLSKKAELLYNITKLANVFELLLK